MSNHVHLILAGQREDCINAFDLFASKLRLAFPKRQRVIDWSKFKMDILPIETLQALRNEIIYANRNAFVANPAYTPDSYPWGGGCAYFCPWLKHVTSLPLGELPILTQRQDILNRRGTLFRHLLIHQQGVLYQDTIPTECTAKDRHRPQHALPLQRHQPASQKKEIGIERLFLLNL